MVVTTEDHRSSSALPRWDPSVRSVIIGPGGKQQPGFTGFSATLALSRKELAQRQFGGARRFSEARSQPRSASHRVSARKLEASASPAPYMPPDKLPLADERKAPATVPTHPRRAGPVQF